jgi:hypothetical protein
MDTVTHTITLTSATHLVLLQQKVIVAKLRGTWLSHSLPKSTWPWEMPQSRGYAANYSKQHEFNAVRLAVPQNPKALHFPFLEFRNRELVLECSQLRPAGCYSPQAQHLISLFTTPWNKQSVSIWTFYSSLKNIF